ncbi:MAG: hypothetical protein HY816_05810 [Candidatus Wallbacteria bacterium]|nr:hypothetical protein [Candidatus Wallbacteria bacterium]
MADQRDPKSAPPRDPSLPGARKPGMVPAPKVSDAEPSSASSARTRLKKPPADPSGSGLTRPGGRMLRPGSGTPAPRSRGGIWRALGAVAVLAALGGGAYWHLELSPEAPAPPPPVSPPPPAATAPVGPEVYLPERGKDKSLPRSYRAVTLDAPEAEARKAGALKQPAADDPWCDGFRGLEEPLAEALGFDFHAKKVCQLTIRYRADKPPDEARLLAQAQRLWGAPTATYGYRTKKSHSVTFWEDVRTLVKLDFEGEGPERRLFALHLADKAGSVERAAARKQ